MNRRMPFDSRSPMPCVSRFATSALICMLMAIPLAAQAGPGAHGPNGEHLDGGATTASQGSAEPRMEAHSEDFELVATLGGGELSVMIDRFATNEPMLGADVQVESQGITAKGTFHKDHGDYVFTDDKLLAALARPGQHPLVFTLIKADESDLLDGVLLVPERFRMGPAHDHGDGRGQDHEQESRRLEWLAACAAALALAGVGWWWRRSRASQATGKAQ